MLKYLQTETERLEKRIKILETEGDHFDVDLCIEKLSTLIKTSWIFARKEIKRFIKLNERLNKCGNLKTELNEDGEYRKTDRFLIVIETYLCEDAEDLKEIISYCEAKAKEHKIKLEDRK